MTTATAKPLAERISDEIQSQWDLHQPVGKVHQFIGWSPRNGNLGRGYNRWRPGRAIATTYEGERGLRLEIFDEPPAGACEKCLERSREIRA